jgi:quinol monooxygenase YgiN
MYGTVARMKVQPGKLDELIKLSVNTVSARRPGGYLGEIIYKMDNNPNEVLMAVFFADKASYSANASDPEMNKEYEKYRALLTADPEWNDGEVIHQFWVGGNK